MSHKDKAAAHKSESEGGACSWKALLDSHLIDRTGSFLADGVQGLKHLISSALAGVAGVVRNKVLECGSPLFENLNTKCGGAVTAQTPTNSVSHHIDAYTRVSENAVLIVLSFSTGVCHR